MQNNKQAPLNRRLLVVCSILTGIAGVWLPVAV
jgi:hypothetical protein